MWVEALFRERLVRRPVNPLLSRGLGSGSPLSLPLGWSRSPRALARVTELPKAPPGDEASPERPAVYMKLQCRT
ncbi:unnamed protein product [Caretta caretta]